MATEEQAKKMLKRIRENIGEWEKKYPDIYEDSPALKEVRQKVRESSPGWQSINEKLRQIQDDSLSKEISDLVNEMEQSLTPQEKQYREDMARVDQVLENYDELSPEEQAYWKAIKEGKQALQDYYNTDAYKQQQEWSGQQQSQPGWTGQKRAYANNPTAQTNAAYSASNMPADYTGYWQDKPYVGGTLQTEGGGFTPEGSYSAGYHGGGGGPQVDRGRWGTGKNMGPMVNGTVQTGGGEFTPEGYYSAGYHGSGEHPEITGESTPGQYKSGSFGPIIKPDLSNGIKVAEFLKYVSQMGYDVSGVDRRELERQYSQSGGNFDGLAFLKTLPQADASKTELISQYASNPMMPTSQVRNLLGGGNFSKLFSPTAKYANAIRRIGLLPDENPEDVDTSKIVAAQKSSPQVTASETAFIPQRDTYYTWYTTAGGGRRRKKRLASEIRKQRR